MYCYTNFALCSPHMHTVLGTWVVTVAIKDDNGSAVLLDDIGSVLLKDLFIPGTPGPRDTVQEGPII